MRCSTPKCKNKVLCKGVCKRCYQRAYMREKGKNSAAYKRAQFKYRMKVAGIELTHREFLHQSAKQKGLCAICKNPPGARRLSVDHCHRTGRFRGLLCHLCNVALGYLRDDAKAAARAAAYLK